MAVAWTTQESASYRYSKINEKCPQFSCPAELRPVQRLDDNLKIWGYSTCPEERNVVEQVFPEYDPVEIYRGKELVAHCCFQRDVCMRTCLMPRDVCHRKYHECVDQRCGKIPDVQQAQQPFKECVQVAQFNSWYSFYKWGKEGGCAEYTEAQREACECVPSARLDAAMKQRMITFYKAYNPSKLNADQSDLKDLKVWRQWREERPRMFYESFMKYRKDSLEVRDRHTLKPLASSERKRRNVVLGLALPGLMSTTTTTSFKPERLPGYDRQDGRDEM